VSPLERRYRRLLIAYPRAHRIAYGEEMLGVLMDSAGPAQRHPSATDMLHLLRHGLLSRARRLPSLPGRVLRFDSPQWTQAASIFAFVGTLLMTGKHAYLLAQMVGWYNHFPSIYVVRFPRDHAIVGCVWLAATVALGLRRSRVGAALAGLALLGELFIAVHMDVYFSAATLMRLTAALLVAVAAALGRRTPMTRGWWMLGLAGAAALFAATGEQVVAPQMSMFGMYPTWSKFGAGIVLLLALAWVVLAQPGPARRRLLVFLAAPVAQLCAFEVYRNGEQSGFGTIGPKLAVALACAAALGAGLTLLAVHRAERLGRLVALGREAEARNRTATPAPPAE
jgi:hypothetical protein